MTRNSSAQNENRMAKNRKVEHHSTDGHAWYRKTRNLVVRMFMKNTRESGWPDKFPFMMICIAQVS